MEFSNFNKAMQQQFAAMVKDNYTLFVTDVDKEVLYNTYLDSYPEGTNNKFKERREYDCNTCKQFICAAGNVVAIVDNKLVSIWDIVVEEAAYQVVAKAMATYVKSMPVITPFIAESKKLGTAITRQDTDNGVIEWNHFNYTVPAEFVHKGSDSIATQKGNFVDFRNAFFRSMTDLKEDVTELVLDLIAQNSLYRGQEFKTKLEEFLTYQKVFNLLPEDERENWVWANTFGNTTAKMRTSAMGVLLSNLSKGDDLEVAVRKYEAVMAPANYKRTKTLYTPKQAENAGKKVEELGLTNSLGRRFAIDRDITINNVLFANRKAKAAMNVFGEMAAEVKDSTKSLGKVEDISIEAFLQNVVPTAESMEVMFENNQLGNLMSVIAPIDAGAPSMFNWKNPFSWAYNGDVTDSMDEKVKAAGGNIDADLRATLEWYNYDDLDIHLIEPNGTRIFHGKKQSRNSEGFLDVDMNANGRDTREGVENIAYKKGSIIPEGRFKVIIHNFSKREDIDVGFTVKLSGGNVNELYTFNKAVPNKHEVTVVEFDYSRSKGITVVKAIESKPISKEAWGITTGKFYPVTMLMNSPNAWDDKVVGNLHTFFILEGCLNPGSPRGFFNEYLTSELYEHRKVFEPLGARMKVEPSDKQLSGLGFSSTMAGKSVIVKVKGSFNRILKVNF